MKLNRSLVLIPLLACFICGAVFCEDDTRKKLIFEFEVIETEALMGRFRVVANREISVDWGDGSVEKFSGSWPGYSRDYGKPVNTTVKIYAVDEKDFRAFTMDEAKANIRFDLRDLPEGVTFLLRVGGFNTVTGDVRNLPAGLTSFNIAGNNTITGDIKNIPGALGSFRLLGENTVSGDVRGIPESLNTLKLHGRNTLGGDLKHIHPGLNVFDVRGENTVSGDTGNIPRGLAFFMSRFTCHGENTIKGNLKDIPRNMVYFNCRGNNNVAGDIADLPPWITYFDLGGANSVSRYSRREWTEGMKVFRFEAPPGSGLDTGEVDSLLKDLAETAWEGEKSLRLGGNAPRSGASDEAVGKLEEMGVAVVVN